MKRSLPVLLFSYLILLVVVQQQSVNSASAVKKKHVTKKPHHLAYFYDPKTNRTLKPPIVSFNADEEELRQTPNRPSFGRRCECKPSSDGRLNVCSCCAGLTLPRIRFQREMCTRFQYNMNQRTSMQMDVTMNGNSVGSQTFNFRAPDPQPFCVPIPVPIIPLRFDACIKLYDIDFRGQNAHFCMDWSARVEMAPLILLHFDCAQFGSEGVSLLKPGQLPQGPTGGFPSVLQPIGGGGGGGGGAVGGTPGVVGGTPGITGGTTGVTGGTPGVIPGTNGPIGPNPGIVEGTIDSGVVLPGSPSTYVETPSQPVTTVPASGPDDMGNLPQVAAGTEDLDQVDDLKHKQNVNKGNNQKNNYHRY